jgi:hypothetical protein
MRLRARAVLAAVLLAFAADRLAAVMGGGPDLWRSAAAFGSGHGAFAAARVSTLAVVVAALLMFLRAGEIWRRRAWITAAVAAGLAWGGEASASGCPNPLCDSMPPPCCARGRVSSW